MTNVLVLVGSPRENGNTEMLADAFIEGAKKKGNNVTKINVGKMKINGCIDCKYCFTHEGKCSQRDGMDEIYPLISNADMIVFATPIYFFEMTAQLKAVVDRLYASAHAGFKISKCALLAVAGGDDKVFEPLLKMYENIYTYIKWENVGIITVSGVNGKGEILNTDGPLKAKELGESIR